MSSGSYMQVNVKCPFYLKDNGKSRIRCEGFADGSSMEWIFTRKPDYDMQITAFCCERYEKCEIYRALMQEKYG